MKKIDKFWSNYTMKRGIKPLYQNIAESDNALIKREILYTLPRELVGPYQTFETVLDYGCGPGHDVLGFLKNTKTKKIIAYDISKKALMILEKRLLLYNRPDFKQRVVMMLGSDGNARLKIKHDTIDHINCIGVLMHCSLPQETIDEFYRVLKPNGTATIMVYNKNSIYFHFYVGYYRRIIEGKYSRLSTEKAFNYCTDSPSCPCTNAYTQDEFIKMCSDFDIIYKGGYFLNKELNVFKKFKDMSLLDPRFEDEHKNFLKQIDTVGQYPTYNGYYCGIGGVYHLTKRG